MESKRLLASYGAFILFMYGSWEVVSRSALTGYLFAPAIAGILRPMKEPMSCDS